MVTQSRKFPLVGSALLAALALSACGSTGRSAPPISLDETSLSQHEVGVRQSTAQLDFAVPADGTDMTATDRARLESFLRHYHARGAGPLIVSMADNAPNRQLVVDFAKEIRDVAWASGIEYSAIEGRVHGGAGSAVVVSFLSYEAVAPDCPSAGEVNWSNVRSNDVHAGFGCSVRKNIAAMISNPQDLLGERELAPGDLARRQTILELFRDGAPTGARRSREEQVTVSQEGN